MKALVFDEKLHLDPVYPDPGPPAGWALIRVLCAGVCRTDQELVKGYMGFKGVLGHEFVGRVVECSDEAWMGRRVVGEINAACGSCEWCRNGLGRHCSNRTVLGIEGLDGCMAEYCMLPVENLHEVPEKISDEAAVFIEPLSAAYEILDQVAIEAQDTCLVLGDGKLGILCAWALSTVSRDVTLVGHHREKLDLAEWNGIKTTADISLIPPGVNTVIEATGSDEGFMQAMEWCRPRGTLVLKSTIASMGKLNLAPIVINELTVVGSRCGLFARGIAGMIQHQFPLERLISGKYPLDDAEEAFAAASERNRLKVLLKMA